jgi:hypothetical protein
MGAMGTTLDVAAGNMEAAAFRPYAGVAWARLRRIDYIARDKIVLELS